MADLEVTELAAKAAAEIRRRGWMQGYYYPHDLYDLPEDEIQVALRDCPVCLVGSIAAALHGTPDHVSGVYQSAIGPELFRRTDQHPPSWNDTPGRTKGEVLALLDSIAAGQ